ncbi:hypothetical protein D3C77_468880 [compost metagenome]
MNFPELVILNLNSFYKLRCDNAKICFSRIIIFVLYLQRHRALRSLAGYLAVPHIGDCCHFCGRFSRQSDRKRSTLCRAAPRRVSECDLRQRRGINYRHPARTRRAVRHGKSEYYRINHRELAARAWLEPACRGAEAQNTALQRFACRNERFINDRSHYRSFCPGHFSTDACAA